MKTLLGYKVVQHREGGLYSAVMSDHYAVQYLVGEEIKPKKGCGPLAVFGMLAQAVRMCVKYPFMLGKVQIWSCEYTPSKEKRLWRQPSITWHRALYSEKIDDFPVGTTFADSVKLIKRVDTFTPLP